jgi:hypothetical protein
MPLSVRLDSGTERLVERLARKRGQTKSEVIRDALGMLVEQEKGGERSSRPYELIAHLVGCVRGGPPDLSVRTGEKFREILLRKKKKRR